MGARSAIWIRWVLACPVRMLRIRMTGDWKSRGHPDLHGKWPLKRCMCVKGFRKSVNISCSYEMFWHTFHVPPCILRACRTEVQLVAMISKGCSSQCYSNISWQVLMNFVHNQLDVFSHTYELLLLYLHTKLFITIHQGSSPYHHITQALSQHVLFTRNQQQGNNDTENMTLLVLLG